MGPISKSAPTPRTSPGGPPALISSPSLPRRMSTKLCFDVIACLIGRFFGFAADFGRGVVLRGFPAIQTDGRVGAIKCHAGAGQNNISPRARAPMRLQVLPARRVGTTPRQHGRSRRRLDRSHALHRKLGLFRPTPAKVDCQSRSQRDRRAPRWQAPRQTTSHREPFRESRRLAAVTAGPTATRRPSKCYRSQKGDGGGLPKLRGACSRCSFWKPAQSTPTMGRE